MQDDEDCPGPSQRATQTWVTWLCRMRGQGSLAGLAWLGHYLDVQVGQLEGWDSLQGVMKGPGGVVVHWLEGQWIFEVKNVLKCQDIVRATDVGY